MRVNCPLSQAVAFLENDVQKALLAIQPDAKRPTLAYAVRKVWILQRNQISQDEGQKSRLRAAYDAAMRPKDAPQLRGGGGGGGGGGGDYGGVVMNPITDPADQDAPTSYGGGGMFGGVGGRKPANPGLPDEAYNDRLTGESMLDDWTFQIAVAIELDPAPFAATAPTAAAVSPQASAQ